MQVSPFSRRLLTLLVTSFVLLLPTGCDQDTGSPPSTASAGASSLAQVASAGGSAAEASAAVPALPDPIPGPDGKVRLSDDEWRARLTPEQFKILRGAGTERPFSCPLWRISDAPGIYHCGGCGIALFDSADKFDSGTGWPSFSHPIIAERILEKSDSSHGMIRVEALCARCEGHLGHVFDDGPPPDGKRYCINGTVLRFAPAKAKP
jgi:peptide-methionine (R)-S-oxide reductase